MISVRASLVADPLEDAVEGRGLDHLAEREFEVEGREIILERDQLFAARAFVDPVHHRRFLGLQRRAAATLAAIMKSSTSLCASSRSRGATDRIRPFSSSTTRRSGMSSSSGPRFVAVGEQCPPARPQRLQRGLDQSGGNGPSISGIEQGDDATSVRSALHVDRGLRIFVGNICGDTNLRRE